MGKILKIRAFVNVLMRNGSVVVFVLSVSDGSPEWAEVGASGTAPYYGAVSETNSSLFLPLLRMQMELIFHLGCGCLRVYCVGLCAADLGDYLGRREILNFFLVLHQGTECGDAVLCSSLGN